MNTIPVRHASLFAATAMCKQSNFGAKQHRLKHKSFQERQDSRVRKPKSERNTKENQLEEAKQFVDVELPEILDAVTRPAFKKCDDLLLALTNTPSLLEKFKIEVDGKERPLIQLGSFTRPSTTELLFLPTMPSLANPIVQKISRFDRYLDPSRTPDGKVRIVIPRITTKRREDTIYEMSRLEGETLPKIHDRRKHALKQLDEIAPHLEYHNKMTLTSEIDEKLKAAETRFKTDLAEKVYDVRHATLDTDVEETLAEESSA